MFKPIAIDFYCGAGGVSEGLYAAGYDVIGVDLFPQKNYSYRFVQGDAIKILKSLLKGGKIHNYTLADIGFIWASPPCQKHTALKHMHNAKEHKDLIVPTRKLLDKTGKPYAIENVEGAPLINPVTLCGSHFNLGVQTEDAEFQLRRHRLIETNFPLAQLECRHQGPVIGVYGGKVRCRSSEFYRNTRGHDFEGYDKKDLARTAMGIDWMNMQELSQSIPPDYARYVARSALPFIERQKCA